VPQEDLQPLVELDLLQTLREQPQGNNVAKGRKGRPPSAVIDLLIKAGHDENKAAQAVMRLLMAAGVPPPKKGGDARGWKRLLEWRGRLAGGIASAEAQDEYEDFSREIAAIPANERVRRVVDEQL
jgi:hypothetical protein